jgi:hypothetical protein
MTRSRCVAKATLPRKNAMAATYTITPAGSAADTSSYMNAMYDNDVRRFPFPYVRPERNDEHRNVAGLNRS